MPASSAVTELARRIKQLSAERQSHVQAIERIDGMLDRVGAALGGGVGRGRGAGAGGVTRRRRKRGRFAVSGDESVLSFVKKQGKATTRQINQYWKNEGRGGSADNTLTRLVKEKKLKRNKLKGQRGSEYTAA